MAEKKSAGFLQNLKKLSLEQKNYADTNEAQKTQTAAKLCPNCGAPRTKQDGLTHCAYCGYKFMDVVLTDGIYIKAEDNSQNV
jgi:ribosomal protein L37AE/L43A